MSATLHPSLPPTHNLTPAAIAPHLLHSPAPEPVPDLRNFMDAYRDTAPDSPHSLCYPSTPGSDSNHLTNSEVQPAFPESITSPNGMLVVYSYGPASAPPGFPLTVQLDFTNLSGTNVRLRVVLGDLALPTSVIQNISSQGGEAIQERGDWKIKIFVPPSSHLSPHVAETGPDGRYEWPLTLQALDSGGSLLDTVGFGLFTYEDLPVSPKFSPAPTLYNPEREAMFTDRSRSPNKRTRDDDDEYSPPTPSKRLTMETDAMHLRRMSVASVDDSLPILQRGSTDHNAFLDSPTLAPPQNRQVDPSLSAHVFQNPLQPHSPAHIQLQDQAHTQHISPEVSAAASHSGEYSEEAAALIRTSQLGHDAKPEQASVAVQGDLEIMKNGWTENEYGTGRRLVQFWKRQVGTTLHVSFAAIPQNEYKENTIVVSCIYRDSTEDCYVTSVDVIYLLEALAGNRFEVEEKNRIRRNLEGFKPMTISKSKPGTEEFFRIIMEFPPPRPRNIEKDVKVFEWGKLKSMLEKVFSKYSTVPLPPQSTPSPHYDGPSSGPPAMFFPLPKNTQGTSAEPSCLPTASASPRRRSQKRRSPVPRTRLHDLPALPPLHIPNQSTHAYPEAPFLPAGYNGTLEYDSALESREYALESGEYAFGSSRFPDIPLELDPALLKVDTSFVNGVGRHLDGFRSGSPLSSDNSPLSMTLSVSSGSSSEAGHLENYDLAGVAISGPEPLQTKHQPL